MEDRKTSLQSSSRFVRVWLTALHQRAVPDDEESPEDSPYSGGHGGSFHPGGSSDPSLMHGAGPPPTEVGYLAPLRQVRVAGQPRGGGGFNPPYPVEGGHNAPLPIPDDYFLRRTHSGSALSPEVEGHRAPPKGKSAPQLNVPTLQPKSLKTRSAILPALPKKAKLMHVSERRLPSASKRAQNPNDFDVTADPSRKQSNAGVSNPHFSARKPMATTKTRRGRRK